MADHSGTYYGGGEYYATNRTLPLSDCEVAYVELLGKTAFKDRGRVKVCDECNRYFTSNSSPSLICSDICSAERRAKTKLRTLRRKQQKIRKAESQKAYYEQNKDTIAKNFKKYREKNKEKIKINQKAYREKNKEKIKIDQKAYREKNKEKTKIDQKAYREKNKEKKRNVDKVYYKKYREKNKEHILTLKAKYRKANRLAINERQRKNYAKNRDAKKFFEALAMADAISNYDVDK